MIKPRLTVTNDTYFLTSPNDFYVSKSVEVYGEWSHGEIELISKIIPKNANIIEAGSNIGSHTVFIARDICPNGKVYAFEPRRTVFQMLCANLALNGIYNVHAYQCGIGDKQESFREGSIDYDTIQNIGGLSLGDLRGQSEKVDITTLDNFLDQNEDISLIKSDIEGYEYRMLQGAKRLIERCRPTMYLENDIKGDSFELISYLHSIHYDVWWHIVPLYRNNNFARTAVNIFGNISMCNILCFPREKNIVINDLIKADNPSFHPTRNPSP